jgi:hypothetical protein
MGLHGYRSVPRCLIFLIIAGGILAFGPIAMATEAVIPQNLSTPEDSRPGPVGLKVSGASAGINTEYFEQAVFDALTASDIFSGIDNTKTAGVEVRMIHSKGVISHDAIDSNVPYILKIRVIRIDAPSFSIRMTISMDVVWSLTRTTDGASLLQEVIPSTYTGGAFEGGLIGADRVRAGTEGAARENIRVGMEMLAALDLGQT